jgi:hypothetical protein
VKLQLGQNVTSTSHNFSHSGDEMKAILVSEYNTFQPATHCDTELLTSVFLLPLKKLLSDLTLFSVRPHVFTAISVT